MKRFLSTCAVVVGALSVASLAHAGPVLDRIKKTSTINIGYRAAAVPFSFTGSEGKPPSGYTIELCNALADAIRLDLKLRGVTINYIPVTAAERFPAIESGKIDLECANTTNTKARRERVGFTMPHYFAAARLLVRDGSGISDIEAMNGKRLVVVKGSTGATIAESRKGQVAVTVVDTNPQAVELVEKGQVDAFMTDDILLHSFRAQSKEKLIVVGRNLSVEPLAITRDKNDAELAALLEREMTTLYTNGKLRTMYRKWFQSPIEAKNIQLNVSPNQLLADMFSRPSTYTVDWVVL